MPSYTLSALNSIPPIFFYNGSLPTLRWEIETPSLVLSENEETVLTECKTQANEANDVKKSTAVNFSTLNDTDMITGFSFGRYPGQLFRPYNADSLIAFAVTSKFNGWQVTRLYPHWSAAADYVDRHALDPTLSLAQNVINFQQRFAAARVDFAYTGLCPGILAHENYRNLYTAKLQQQPPNTQLLSNAYGVTETISFDAAKAAVPTIEISNSYTYPEDGRLSKMPSIMHRADSLHECFKAIGAVIPGFQEVPAATVEQFEKQLQRYDPGVKIKFGDQPTTDFHYAIEASTDPEDRGFYWGAATQLFR